MITEESLSLSSSRTFEIGDLCRDRYRVTGLIGEGGMGEVYEAMDEALGRRVALKVVSRGRAGDPVFSAGQRKEARTLARLDHPNIVRVYDTGIDKEGLVYFVMERIDGVSLGRLLDALGAQELVDTLSIGVQIADALELAHEAGIIHRDLKPENVLVMKNGLAKVVDFGVAKRDEGGPREGRSERRRGAPSSDVFDDAGTLYYMAPEQIARRGARRASDIYALGLILHEMLTGEYVFVDADGALPSREEASRSHLEEEPALLSAVVPDFDAPALEALVAQMLAKRPEERPTAREVRDVLGGEYRRREAEHPATAGKLARAGGARRPARPAHVPRPVPIEEVMRRSKDSGMRPVVIETEPLSPTYRPPENVLPFRRPEEGAAPPPVVPASGGRWPRTEPMARVDGVAAGAGAPAAVPAWRWGAAPPGAREGAATEPLGASAGGRQPEGATKALDGGAASTQPSWGQGAVGAGSAAGAVGVGSAAGAGRVEPAGAEGAGATRAITAARRTWLVPALLGMVVGVSLMGIPLVLWRGENAVTVHGEKPNGVALDARVPSAPVVIVGGSDLRGAPGQVATAVASALKEREREEEAAVAAAAVAAAAAAVAASAAAEVRSGSAGAPAARPASSGKGPLTSAMSSVPPGEPAVLQAPRPPAAPPPATPPRSSTSRSVAAAPSKTATPHGTGPAPAASSVASPPPPSPPRPSSSAPPRPF